MNERIKELAEQAGFGYLKNLESWVGADTELERFAQLAIQNYISQIMTTEEREENIRSEERKACAEHYLEIMRDAVEQAVLKEREACAKLCESITIQWANTFAQAIRKRGEK